MFDSVILFIFGTIVGSFLNVVGLRWSRPDEALAKSAMRNFGGRSKCLHCYKTLRWYELIPLASFLLQRGRCRHCKLRISFQYPLIEVLTGLILIFLYSLFGLTIYYLLFTIISCIYIVILIYDFHHKIIPDRLVYSAIILALIFRIFFISDFGFRFSDLAAGPILFLFFASIWFFSKGRAMGFGDAKLSLSVGLLLGAAEGFSAIILAFWIGAVISIILMIFSKLGLLASRQGFVKNTKHLTIKSEIPFAPFIILGVWLSAIWQLDLLHVLSF